MEEFIKGFIYYLTLIASSVALVLTINKTLKIYQDSRYHVKDSFSYIWRFYLKFYLYFALVPFVFILDSCFIQLLYCIYLGYLIYQLLTVKTISKLRFTARIIRHYFVIGLIYITLGICFVYHLSLIKILPLLSILIILSPLLSLLVGLAMLPIEAIVSSFYQHIALKKLKKYRPLVIGITGSCGKTSVKNFLYEILKDKTMVYMSPKSFNTINGISMTINQYVSCNDLTLILEMGATKLNDISSLVSYTAPVYGFVTEIVPQHMITFKSIDNIITEKFKLIEGLPANGVGFLNYDNFYIRNYHLQAKCKIISYGSTPDCDIYASEVKMALHGLSFRVNYQDGSFLVNSQLVGIHNVNNLLAAIAYCLEFKVLAQDIIDSISVITPVKHRLEIYVKDGITIIDDAYNSNISGFKNALQVLGLARNKKTLLTPGIIDAGKDTNSINNSLSVDISKYCDQVILVDNPSSRYIYEGLVNLGYQNIIIVSSFKEGIKLVTEGTVLIENDLPDNYFI